MTSAWVAVGVLGALAAGLVPGRRRVLREQREAQSRGGSARRVGLGGPLWSGRFGPDRA